MKKTAIKLALAASLCALIIGGVSACAPAAGDDAASAPPATDAQGDTTATAPSQDGPAFDTGTLTEPGTAAPEPEPSSEPAPAPAPADSGSGGLTKESAEQQGYQVFEGTVRVCDAQQLIELQGIDVDPSAVGGVGTYAVLVFDQPTEVRGMSGDGTGVRSEEATMLGIAEYSDYGSFVSEYGDLEAMKALDGQHVTLAAQESNIMFPSDVRLPVGQPSSSSVTIIE